MALGLRNDEIEQAIWYDSSHLSSSP
jgi:hypothetical protein